MKKYFKCIILFLLLFLILNLSLYTNAANMNLVLNNKITQVRTTPIMINDKIIYTSFPSFIYQDRTYVPIRFISEIVGSKVTWNKNDSSLLIQNGNDTLRLFANQNYASINGNTISLDNSSKPIIVNLNGCQNGHTMIPMVFISDFLKLESGFDSTRKLPFIKSSNINLKNNTSNEIETVSIIDNFLFLEGANNSDFEIITLENPSRIVIDIKNSLLKGRDKFNLNQNLLYINNIRGSQFITNKVNPNENTVRIVLDLKNNSNMFYLDIVPTENNLKIYPKIK